MARLFFALWPDDVTRSKLNEVSEQFINEGFRFVKKANLHMTLEFLGEVDSHNQKELILKAGKIRCKTFDMEFTHIDWWRKPQILWIGTSNIPNSLIHLVKSVKKCVKQQGLKTDDKPYKPHITIARKVKKVVIPKETIYVPWAVNSFALVVSRSVASGVEYQVLQEWPLQK
ncbi:MAG: RNA 2',3'-cyclic phosphodiesterase [Candidatus Dadabacteria bacterium]|nr:RNA 2',3'-cyclic phosphodiesterase [Candidatus Dadabacteria bacterium]